MIRKLSQSPHKYQKPKEANTIGSININPQGRKSINAGDYSENNPPPKLYLDIIAINKNNVEYKIEKLGTKKNYILIYNIHNKNDHPITVFLKINEKK